MGTSSVGSHRGRKPQIELPDGGGTATGAATDDNDGGGSLSDDDLFEVLHNPRRQQVVEYLRAGDGTATAGELAEHIAAAENDKSVAELSSYERKRVYVSLYQNHLTVMADANVIDYDEDRKEVSLREEAADLDPYLDGDVDGSDVRIPIAAAIVVGTIVLLGAFQVSVFGVAPAEAWAMLGAVGLLGVAGISVYRTHSA